MIHSLCACYSTNDSFIGGKMQRPQSLTNPGFPMWHPSAKLSVARNRSKGKSDGFCHQDHARQQEIESEWDMVAFDIAGRAVSRTHRSCRLHACPRGANAVPHLRTPCPAFTASYSRGHFAPRASPVPASPRTGFRITRRTDVRTSAGSTTGASGSVLRTTARGSLRIAARIKCRGGSGSHRSPDPIPPRFPSTSCHHRG